MTRINSGIHPSFLASKHLLAEHREIKRIPNVIKSGKFHMTNQPKEFTLGSGHVKFFYDKLFYLYRRYYKIHAECIRRGFKVQDYSEAWIGLEQTTMFNDWSETIEAHNLVRNRINERLGLPLDGRFNRWSPEFIVTEPRLILASGINLKVALAEIYGAFGSDSTKLAVSQFHKTINDDLEQLDKEKSEFIEFKVEFVEPPGMFLDHTNFTDFKDMVHWLIRNKK